MDFAAILKAEREKAAAEKHIITQSDNTASSGFPSSVLISKTTTELPTIHQLEPGIAYCENFLSSLEEEAELIESINCIPFSQWATLKQRRLLNLGGVPHPCGSWSEELPAFTKMICSKLVDMDIFNTPPNQILLNEYLDGAGIDPHNDGPLFEPLVCVVSLGGDAVLDFYHKSDRSKIEKSVILKQRSLLIFSHHMYLEHLHGISTTMRDVIDEKVINTREAQVELGQVLERSPRRLSITIRSLSCVKKHIGKYDVLSQEDKEEQDRREAWWFSSISEK